MKRVGRMKGRKEGEDHERKKAEDVERREPWKEGTYGKKALMLWELGRVG